LFITTIIMSCADRGQRSSPTAGMKVVWLVLLRWAYPPMADGRWQKSARPRRPHPPTSTSTLPELRKDRCSSHSVNITLHTINAHYRRTTVVLKYPAEDHSSTAFIYFRRPWRPRHPESCQPAAARRSRRWP